jgi:hypothetical protein
MTTYSSILNGLNKKRLFYKLFVLKSKRLLEKLVSILLVNEYILYMSTVYESSELMTILNLSD